MRRREESFPVKPPVLSHRIMDALMRTDEDVHLRYCSHNAQLELAKWTLIWPQYQRITRQCIAFLDVDVAWVYWGLMVWSELTNVNNWIGKHGFPLQTPKCDQKQYCWKNFHLSRRQNLSTLGSEKCRSDSSLKSFAERLLVLLSNCQPMLFFASDVLLLKAKSSITRVGEHPSKHPDAQDLQANPNQYQAKLKCASYTVGFSILPFRRINRGSVR